MLERKNKLFPACAGVIPGRGRLQTLRGAFPRMRGGDPSDADTVRRAKWLFPACAGVIPRLYALSDLEVPFPRMRGGDPLGTHTARKYAAFSPHARG